jgi:hypothetical protein
MVDVQLSAPTGKLTGKDTAMARVLKIAPWVAVPAVALPAPLVFLALFLTAATTESAALFLVLAGFSTVVGLGLGLLIATILFIYQRRWLSKLRDRLASDGITASEVVWFRSELTSAEKASLAEIEQSNPLLADAYLETLASRLTASRILSRAKREILRVERRINRARTLTTRESATLQEDLLADRQRLDQLREQASQALIKAKTRLQVIEATASRALSQAETELMMQRLGSTQDQLPLVLEIAELEREALRDPRLTDGNKAIEASVD